MAVDTELVQVAVVEARENGDRQHEKRWIHLRRYLGRGRQHLSSTTGMHRQHAYSEARSFGHCGSDGVWNIVIFQVEKHSPAGGHQIAHHARTFGGVELHSHLVAEGGVSHRRHDFSGGGSGVDVESNDQTLARIAHLSKSSTSVINTPEDEAGRF